ncbi:MAG TPA: radical SAM protein, partial [archaeon]|nr:radical SAM protein [archaeon]
MDTIKETQSICPECLTVIKATIYKENGQVLIKKTCPTHGSFQDLYWSDYDEYMRAEKFRHEGDGLYNPRTKTVLGCPYDCGICPNHKTHTVLAIID